MAGADVVIGDLRRATADREGRFTLCRVAPGTAGLEVRSLGYAAREERVELVPGDTAHVSIALRRSGVIQIRDGGPLPAGALVIVDGVRVFHSSGGCEEAPPGTPTLEGIEPDEIDRIEVMKASRAVAVYGPEARSGAVLITTKRRAERRTP